MGSRKIGIGLLVSLMLLLVPAGAAQANTNVSVNWSGYAVHRSAVKFRRVVGHWVEPAGTCANGSSGFSAFWVGIGGYRLTSDALEQIGTEFDCTATGRKQIMAWYELVPSRSHVIHMTVREGDELSASVRVIGTKVTVSLKDLTRHESFSRTSTDHHTDNTSAEWITEAPSICSTPTNCQTLPLADFGTVGFTGARAETTHGHWGTISSSQWSTTKIILASAGGSRYVSGGSSATEATPGPLSAGGRAFTVAFTDSTSTSTTTQPGILAAPARAGLAQVISARR